MIYQNFQTMKYYTGKMGLRYWPIKNTLIHNTLNKLIACALQLRSPWRGMYKRCSDCAIWLWVDILGGGRAATFLISPISTVCSLGLTLCPLGYSSTFVLVYSLGNRFCQRHWTNHISDCFVLDKIVPSHCASPCKTRTQGHTQKPKIGHIKVITACTANNQSIIDCVWSHVLVESTSILPWLG